MSNLTSFTTSVTVSSNGRIVIPAELRKLMGIKDNDKLVFRYNDGELVLASQQKALLKAQSFFAKKTDKIKSHTDDFLKNRKKIWGE